MLRIAIFVFLSLSLYAVNLEDFIELSLRNETNLIKENEILKANNEKDKALSAYFPSISLESAYNANNGDVFIDRAKESLYAVFSLSYIIYDGGKREAQFKGAKSMQNLALLNSQFTKQNTVYKACVLYFNYLSLEKIISASKAKENFLQNSLNNAQKMFLAGLKSKEEFESIKAVYHQSKIERMKNELKLNEIEKEIFILSKERLVPSKISSLQEPKYHSTDSIEVKIAREEENLAKLNLDIARSKFYPTFYIQNNYGFYQNNFDFSIPNTLPPFAINFVDRYFKRHSQSNQFIIAMQWKIFDFKLRSSELENSRLDFYSKKLQTRLNERKNKAELEYSLKELQVLKEQISALELNLDASNLSFESIDKKYKSGLKSLNDYLKALDDKFNSISRLELAKNEYEIAKARYYFLAGLDIRERIQR